MMRTQKNNSVLEKRQDRIVTGIGLKNKDINTSPKILNHNFDDMPKRKTNNFMSLDCTSSRPTRSKSQLQSQIENSFLSPKSEITNEISLINEKISIFSDGEANFKNIEIQTFGIQNDT